MAMSEDTRDRILALLRQGREVSGQVISQELGVSRAAVAKQIQVLRARGYAVEAAAGRGYRLIQAPDLLNSAEITPWLKQEPLWSIYSFPELDSTNNRLRDLAEQGAPEFTVVIAESQTAGKGRLGRAWHSPAGCGLWMSLLLRPALPPQSAQVITLTTAIAVAQAIGDLGLSVGIKWPNDVLTPDRRKLCGIRCEMRSDTQQVEWLVVGLGVNINNAAFPPELAAITSSLEQLAGRPLRRSQVAAAVLDRMLLDYRLLLREGFAPLREQWLDLAIGLGQPVSIVDMNGQRRQGLARGLDQEGYLLLETESGISRVLAGDMVLEA